MPKHEQFSELIYKYISGSLTDKENRMLMHLLNDAQYANELENIMREIFEQSGEEVFWDSEYQQLFANRIINHDKPSQETAHRKLPFLVQSKYFLNKWRWAAIVIVFIGVTGIILFLNRPDNSNKQTDLNMAKTTLIQPGSDKAILTLADGSNIILDSSNDGVLTSQGGTEIIKLGQGEIRYDQKNELDLKIVENTMTTPKGGQYKLTLPDGTKVWLNAASSITYPTVFRKGERKVTISGEVYFEVASVKDDNNEKKIPFLVNVRSEIGAERSFEISVLGTHFNIKAYDDEPIIKTSLLEGSIQIQKNKDQYLLYPGQQIYMEGGKVTKIASEVEPDEIVAWKNGYFFFEEHSDLQTVLRQIARWYDLTVEYKSAVPNLTFSGEISRKSSIDEILEVLKKAKLKVILENKKLIVLP